MLLSLDRCQTTRSTISHRAYTSTLCERERERESTYRCTRNRRCFPDYDRALSFQPGSSVASTTLKKENRFSESSKGSREDTVFSSGRDVCWRVANRRNVDQSSTVPRTATAYRYRPVKSPIPKRLVVLWNLSSASFAAFARLAPPGVVHSVALAFDNARRSIA